MPFVPGSPIPGVWHTPSSARELVRSGLPVDDELLTTLLEIAAQQVVEFGPIPLDELNTVPPHYRQAQLMQTKNIWSAVSVDSGSGNVPEGTYQLRPFPLDWMVRQIIRPKRAVPGVY